MTIGIYLLRFTGTDKVYVGQSISIERRITEHINCLKNKSSSNKKMQEAYNNFGPPKLEILIECTREELDKNEIEAIEIFNSVKGGLNMLSLPGNTEGLQGEEHGSAKYSNEQIAEILDILIDCPNKSYQEISKIVNIPRETICSISNFHGHKWLEKAYPEKYLILRSLKGSRTSIRKTAKEMGIVYPPITSPEGKIFIVEHLCKFAKEHTLDPGHLSKVLRGITKQHKGWKLVVQ